MICDVIVIVAGLKTGPSCSALTCGSMAGSSPGLTSYKGYGATGKHVHMHALTCMRVQV